MRLCDLNHTIEHISGSDNIWDNIMSRWRSRDVTREHHVVPVAEMSAIRPQADEDFVFPTFSGIVEAQNAAGRENPDCNPSLRRKEESMILVLKERFLIVKLNDKVAKFNR
ncbi:Chromodomain containing hypothetical protein [Phytophthora palmivora]|uniref:Uncharacterized protein n=1 Tax=Phytophthora palmivora TaxID=4796 RepID=A0A2P4XNF7_9STRA|nr:Chromodomain containing hypothetical protein [Phytophthora palmivora]